MERADNNSPGVSRILSLPLHVQHLIIEHCYFLNDQQVVRATGALRVASRDFFRITLSHPLWHHITQYTNCELCEFKKARSSLDPDVCLGTSSKDPAFFGTLYLHHMGLLKCKATYTSYLKYYQFEQGIPNVFHIHRVCGGFTEMDTIACLMEQEMQLGNNRDFRVVLLVEPEAFNDTVNFIASFKGSQFLWKPHEFRYSKYQWLDSQTSKLLTFVVQKHHLFQFYGHQFKNAYIGVTTSLAVDQLDRLAVDVLFVVGVAAAKHLYSTPLFDAAGRASDLILLQPYFKIISIV